MEPEPELKTCFFNHQFSGEFCALCGWKLQWNLDPVYSRTGTSRYNNYLVGTGDGWFKLSPIRKGHDNYGAYPILKCYGNRTEIIKGKAWNFDEEVAKYFADKVIERDVKNGTTTFQVSDASNKRQRDDEEDVTPPKKKRKLNPKVVIEPMLEKRIDSLELQLKEIKELLEKREASPTPPQYSPEIVLINLL